jgi:hypothetical protein
MRRQKGGCGSCSVATNEVKSARVTLTPVKMDGDAAVWTNAAHTGWLYVVSNHHELRPGESMA